MKSLSDKLAKEGKYRTRLSIHNEELQWKLKQNSERHQKTLQELSKSFHENSMYQRSDEDLMFHNDGGSSGDVTISPPVSPKVKGMVKTSDAVSWILEMDDDSADQVASRAIRRVGSFRASPTALKRSKSSQSPMNPLSQSASATSILRQCSAETSPMKGCESAAATAATVGSRSRSKSMSVKPSVDRRLAGTPMKKAGDQQQQQQQLEASFQMPIYSSSPYKHEQQAMNGEEPPMAMAVVVEKKKAVSKNLSFSRTRASSFGTSTTSTGEGNLKSLVGLGNRTNGGGGKMAKDLDLVPQESAGEAMILNISDGEDILSVNSSLTTSTSSSADEETAGEKERTAISIHQSMEDVAVAGRRPVQGVTAGSGGGVESALQEMVYASLKNNSCSSSSNNLNGSAKWSPRRLMNEIAMEEDEDEDVFDNNSSVV